MSQRFTGRTRTQPCCACAFAVEHGEIVTTRDDKVWMLDWLAKPHYAPCGIPCVGGGVLAQHGYHGEACEDGSAFCPRCGVVTLARGTSVGTRELR